MGRAKPSRRDGSMILRNLRTPGRSGLEGVDARWRTNLDGAGVRGDLTYSGDQEGAGPGGRGRRHGRARGYRRRKASGSKVRGDLNLAGGNGARTVIGEGRRATGWRFTSSLLSWTIRPHLRRGVVAGGVDATRPCGCKASSSATDQVQPRLSTRRGSPSRPSWRRSIFKTTVRVSGAVDFGQTQVKGNLSLGFRHGDPGGVVHRQARELIEIQFRAANGVDLQGCPDLEGDARVSFPPPR